MIKEHEPMRTCVGCRGRKAKTHLLRFVLDDRRHLVLDEKQLRKGRGAYLCAESRCLDRALAKRAFPRALRGQVSLPDTEALKQRIGRVGPQRGSVA